MTMRKVLLMGVLLLVVVSTGLAEDQNEPNGFSAAFSLTELAGNFGMGLGVQSPLILNAAAVRAEVQAFWLNAPGSAEIWYPFLVARAGLAGYTSLMGGFMRLYGYSGAEFVFPSIWTDYIDSEIFRFGGFGGFGFEFFFTADGCYYIELGTTGSGAKTRFDPQVYRNGFQTLVGLRWYF